MNVVFVVLVLFPMAIWVGGSSSRGKTVREVALQIAPLVWSYSSHDTRLFRLCCVRQGIAVTVVFGLILMFLGFVVSTKATVAKGFPRH